MRGGQGDFAIPKSEAEECMHGVKVKALRTAGSPQGKAVVCKSTRIKHSHMYDGYSFRLPARVISIHVEQIPLCVVLEK